MPRSPQQLWITKHRQVRVELHGELIDVDEEIAPLLKRIWDLGIETLNSCQEQDGRTWIEFASVNDIKDFLSSLMLDDSGEHHDLYSFRNRVFRTREPNDDWEAFRRDVAWHYGINVTDLNVGDDTADIMICPVVRFPASDLPEVMRRLQSAVRPSSTTSGSEPSIARPS
jgi:hypothetical protein